MKRIPRAPGYAGLFAAAVAVVSDLALQYTPVAAHVGSPDYAYLLDVPRERLLFGHFVGVVAVSSRSSASGTWRKVSCPRARNRRGCSSV